MTNAAQSVSGGLGPSNPPVVDAFAPVPAPPPPIEIAPAPDNGFSEEAVEAASAPPVEIGPETSAQPSGWRELRDTENIQFEPIENIPLPPPEPREPGWFDEALRSFFSFLGDVLSPLGKLLAANWFWLQWALLAVVVGFVLYMIARTIGPLSGRNRRRNREAISEPEWAPSAEQSVALLEEADRLAAEGRYDEATHLLLQRSVSHISTARPDWVEPSSTARELVALPALSQTARSAFGTIAERVERSLFALSALDRTDWDAARKAYADFALTKIEDREAVQAQGAGG